MLTDAGKRAFVTRFSELCPDEDLEFTPYTGASTLFEEPSPEEHAVRFSEMTEEAEREMAEWDAILRRAGRRP